MGAFGGTRLDNPQGLDLRHASVPADEVGMAKHSLRGLLRKKRMERAHLSLQMRELMNSFEAEYGQQKPRDKKSAASSARDSQDSS